MRYYLSSYRMWSVENVEKFQAMVESTNKRIAMIPNASDAYPDWDRKSSWNVSVMQEVADSTWAQVDILDLRNYFGKKNELAELLKWYDVFRVRWWNTFILREAMKRSGFDTILLKYHTSWVDKVYWWYSAWVCVLCPDLSTLNIVDDPTLTPYEWTYENSYDWLWILDYYVFPHYDSDHPESEDIQKEVEHAKDRGLYYKTLRDWEVIIIN